MLEETGLPYRIIPVNIGRGDQFDPDFMAISPNNKIPAIIDHEGPGGKPLPLFESAAILLYLAEKSGKFLPNEEVSRWQAIQWLQFQAASLGPMLGQAQHFLHYAPERVNYGVERYGGEAKRLYGVLEVALGRNEYLAGSEYTVADIATWPWLRAWKIQGVDLDLYPNIARWMAKIGERPAILREREVLAEHKRDKASPIGEIERRNLFGRAAG